MARLCRLLFAMNLMPYYSQLMRFLQHIRLAFQRHALRRMMERQTSLRGSVHYDDARLIGILFDASELKEREQALQFAEKLRRSGKKVSLLGFFDHEVERSEFTFPVFTRADFNWNMHSRNDALSRFIQEPLDLLIHADTQSDMYAAAVAAAGMARLRVGPYTGRTECYELMVDTSGNHDLAYYLKQVEFLLQKTNARNEAA